MLQELEGRWRKVNGGKERLLKCYKDDRRVQEKEKVVQELKGAHRDSMI